jgi:hypothetical protein
VSAGWWSGFCPHPAAELSSIRSRQRALPVQSKEIVSGCVGRRVDLERNATSPPILGLIQCGALHRALYASRQHKELWRCVSPAELLSNFILFLDVRDRRRERSLYSAAIDLTPANARRLFKGAVLETPRYEEEDSGGGAEGFYCEPGEGALLDLGGAPLGDRLAFDLTVFCRRTQRMAVLGSGEAETSPSTAGYGPAFGVEAGAGAGAEGAREHRFFGEGGEFLSAVPLFAWLFFSEGKGAVRFRAAAIEVTYVDSADDAERPEDEVLMCLAQILQNQLVWT